VSSCSSLLVVVVSRRTTMPITGPNEPRRRRRWTREAILAEIRRLDAEGECLSTRARCRLGLSGMVTTTYRQGYFGGWRGALRAAGLDPGAIGRRPRKWTRERVVARIRDLHDAGEDLSHSAAKRDHQYLVVAARRKALFGSWAGAVEAAGIPYSSVSRHESWDKRKIVRRIRELYRRGEPLSHDEARSRHGALVAAASSARHFGSWRRAVVAAGLRYDEIRKTTAWTPERIVETIRRLKAAGAPLTVAQMRRSGYRAMVDAALREPTLGSWEAALRAAGVVCDTMRAPGRAHPTRRA